MRAPRYSALRHLAMALGGRDYPHLHFGMFTAYFDASGKAHDPEIMFVSGFVSSTSKWLKFERRWADLLQQFSVSPPFHTTDYIAGRPGYGQFNGNDALRDEFEDRVGKIIKRTTRKPVSVGVMLAELRQVQNEYTLPLDPYQLCGSYGVKLVREWKARHPEVREVEFVYEEGDGKIGGFMADFRKRFGSYPAFRPKNKHPQFQAADVLAWRHARLVRDHVAGISNRREAFGNLFRQLPHDTCVVIDGDTLRRACDDMGVTRR